MGTDSQSFSSFEKTIIVKRIHIDDLNHVNNVVYLTWINDIAKNHWINLSSKEILAKYSWIVLRHEINYLAPSFLNNKLTIKTWVGENTGSKSTRYTEIYREKTKIITAKSTWCLLSSTSLKPIRIPVEIQKLFI